MNRLLWIPILLVGCAGAGSAHYSEADSRTTVTADLETTFYVSLPDSVTAKAAFSPALLALGRDGIDPLAHRRILEFTAKSPGETEIKAGADFSLRVQVTSAADHSGMMMHQH